MNKEDRGRFSNKLGFILAASGSAVGLGNLWRFPYLAAKYGGGVFIFTYIVLVLTFGFTLLMTEICIGRKTSLSAIGAFKKLNKKFAFIGIIGAIVCMIIVPYYSVIGGWILKYFATFITGSINATTNESFFPNFISSNVEPILWQALFIIAALVILLGGVKNGVEKANKILMPMLIGFSIIIVVYSLTLDGAIEGLKYLFLPNFEKFSVMGVLAAMGQMFFSMSLAMAVMITYGSYMKKSDDVESAVSHIEIFDTGIAILASMMIIPAVFSFSGGTPEALGKGPSLMFITMPKIFDKMAFGSFFGALFFLLVFFAAITSVVSLLEALVSMACDKFKLKRKNAVLIIISIIFLISLLPSLGYGALSNITILHFDILDFMDFVANYILMPLGAFLTCIFIGYIIKPKAIIEEVESSGKFRRKAMYVIILKYIAPVLAIIVLLSSVLDAFGIIRL